MNLNPYDILIACEFSGIIRDTFIREGYSAISCDFDPTTSTGPHIEDDVRPVLHEKRWKLVIAHPPCNYLCNSGVRHLYKDGLKKNGRNLYRWAKMVIGVQFFETCLFADADRIAVENPIMHGYAKAEGIGHPDFIVQPWMFGDPYSKATCFWTRDLPALVPTYPTKQDFFRETGFSHIENAVHNTPPSADRGKKRSITYQGIADAIVNQWGPLL